MTILSICIATYNRANFIGETIESIVPKLSDSVELLIIDGASPDNTEEVVRGHMVRHPSIRYCREEANSGVDADYDRAVQYASGEYCWLMPDDDLMMPGAIDRVLGVLQEGPELVVVDALVKDASLETTLMNRRLGFSGLRRYTSAEADRFMADTGDALTFIGAAIVQREWWLSRDRERYYGTLFIHVGAIFQKPLIRNVIAIGEPLLTIRYGNAMWTPRRFEIWAFKWPDLVWSFEGYSEWAKQQLVPRHPWRSLKRLIAFRTMGAYGYQEYCRFFRKERLGWWRLVLVGVAVMPGRLAHLVATAFLSLKGKIDSIQAYDLLMCSPYSNSASRFLASATRRLAAS